MLKTNTEHARKVIDILLDWYKKRDGLFSGSELPESETPNGLEIGSYEQIMFLTMTVAIDYQRSANDLWHASRKSWEDDSIRWIFSPKEVVNKTRDELVESLAKYKLSKKREKDTDIWRTISQSLVELFDGDPRNLFEKFDYDAYQIVTAMRRQYGKNFPYLAGSTGTGKILSLWIRMLHKEAKIKFKNLKKVPIPIDIHTARATIMTGCLSGTFEGNFSALAELSKQAWIDACDGTEHYPLELDEALWNLSRFGCTNYRNGNVCPVKDQCRLEKYCTANNPLSEIQINQNDLTVIDSKLPGEK